MLRLTLVASLAVAILIPVVGFSASVDLTPPKNSMGYADENGFFRIIQRFGDVEFSNGFSIPLRFDFWTGRKPAERKSEYGWHGWKCGALESRVSAYGGDKFLKVDLLCAKTLFLEKVEDTENQYISPDSSWLGLLEENEFTLSRADGWKLTFVDERISRMTTDDGLVIEWIRDPEGRLISVREEGSTQASVLIEWSREEDKPATVSKITTGKTTRVFDFKFKRPAHLNYSMNVDWQRDQKKDLKVFYRHTGNQLEIESGKGLIRQFDWEAASGWLESDGINRYHIEKNEEQLVTVQMESATGKETSRIVKSDEVILQAEDGARWKTKYNVEPGLNYRKITGIWRQENVEWLPVMQNFFNDAGQLVGREFFGDYHRYSHYDNGDVEEVIFPEAGLTAVQFYYIRDFREQPFVIEYEYDDAQRHAATKVDGKVVYQREFNKSGKVTRIHVSDRYTRLAEFADDGSYTTNLKVAGLSENNWPLYYKKDKSLVPTLQMAASYSQEEVLLRETLLDRTLNQYQYDGEDLISKKHVAADGKTLISELRYARPDGKQILVTDQNFLERKTRYFLLTTNSEGQIVESTALSDIRARRLLNEI